MPKLPQIRLHHMAALFFALFLAVHGRYIGGAPLYPDEEFYVGNSVGNASALHTVFLGTSPDLAALAENFAYKIWRVKYDYTSLTASEAAQRFGEQTFNFVGKPLYQLTSSLLASVSPHHAFNLMVAVNILLAAVGSVFIGALYAARGSRPTSVAAWAAFTFSLIQANYLASAFPVAMEHAFLVMAVAAYFLSMDGTVAKSLSGRLAFAAGVCFGLSQMAYPSTIFVIVLLALSEAVIAVVSLRRRWGDVALLVAFCLWLAVPAVLPFVWSRFSMEMQGSQNDPAFPLALRQGLSFGVTTLVAAGGWAFWRRWKARDLAPNIKLVVALWAGLWLSFDVMNLPFALRGLGYLTEATSHAPPLMVLTKDFFKPVYMLFHAEGPAAFWALSMLYGVGSLRWAYRLLIYRRLDRTGMVSILLFPALLWFTNVYAFNFEKRSYLAFYLFFQLGALYGLEGVLHLVRRVWDQTQPLAGRMDWSMAVALIIAAGLAANFFPRARSLFWNQRQAFLAVHRELERLDLHDVLLSSELIGYVASPRMSPFGPGRIDSESTTPRYVLRVERKSQPRGATLGSDNLLRGAMEAIWWQQRKFDHSVDGHYYTTFGADPMTGLFQNFDFTLYKFVPHDAAMRSIEATTAFRPEDWLAKGPESAANLRFVAYGSELLGRAGGSILRISPSVVADAVAQGYRYAYLTVFAYGPHPVTLALITGKGRLGALTFWSEKEGAAAIPLTLWLPAEDPDLSLAIAEFSDRYTRLASVMFTRTQLPEASDGKGLFTVAHSMDTFEVSATQAFASGWTPAVPDRLESTDGFRQADGDVWGVTVGATVTTAPATLQRFSELGMKYAALDVEAEAGAASVLRIDTGGKTFVLRFSARTQSRALLPLPNFDPTVPIHISIAADNRSPVRIKGVRLRAKPFADGAFGTGLTYQLESVDR